MESSHSLPIGEKLGGHYEIVEVLGEDEFEILYLVKDLHLGEKKFVLKELFLSAYASRDEQKQVQVMAKSKQIFEQTKVDVKAEVDALKAGQSLNSPELYGYFEENNTLYTIMEFVENASDTSYLNLKSTESSATASPVLTELVNEPIFVEEKVTTPEVVSTPLKVDEIEEERPHQEEVKQEKSSNSYWFLKLLILGALVMAGLMYYSYDMIQKDKERAKNKPTNVTVTNEPMAHPTLKEKIEKVRDENLSILEVPQEEVKKENLEGAAYIEEGELPPVTEEEFENIPKAEIYVDSEVETIDETIAPYGEVVSPEPMVVEVPVSGEKKPSFSLGTKIN